MPLRIDAGIIASPLGLNTLELLPSKNPIGAPFFYFAPLPRFDTRYDGVQLISGGYPSGRHRQQLRRPLGRARRLTDQSPTRKRNVFGSAGHRSRDCRSVAGGGYTPFAGAAGRRQLRAWRLPQVSGYPASSAVAGTDATVFTVEGEYTRRLHTGNRRVDPRCLRCHRRARGQRVDSA